MTESGEDVVQSVDEADTIDSSLLRMTESRKDVVQSDDEADTVDCSQIRMTEYGEDVVQSVDEADKDSSQNSPTDLQSISSSKTEFEGRRSTHIPSIEAQPILTEEDNLLQAAFNILYTVPRAIEDFIDREYEGGLLQSIRDHKDQLKAILISEEWELLSQLIAHHRLYHFYDKIIQDTILDKDVLDLLISKCILRIEDRAEIEHHPKPSDRNKCILDLLIQRPEDSYSVLLEVLKESPTCSKDLIECMEGQHFSHHEVLSQSKVKSCSTGNHSIRLQKNYYNLIQNLSDVRNVIDSLISKGVLEPDDHADIASSGVSAEMNRKLIAKIRSKQDYMLFLEALKEDPMSANAELASVLESTDVNQDELNQTANIPQLTNRPGFQSLVTLVSMVKAVQISDTEPESHDSRLAADLYRLQSLYNKIIKMSSMDLDKYQQFVQTVNEIFGRISGKSDPVVKETTLSTVMQKQVKKMLHSLKEKEENSELKEKLKKMETDLGEIIPKNIRELIKKQVEDWEKKDKMFVSTRASDYVMEQLQDNSCLTLTAPSGVGKSFTARHTALVLKKEGYNIIPVELPADIRDYYQPGKQTVFIVDDICGNFTANQQQIDNWKQLLPVIKTIMADKCCKIIVSCRLQVYKDEKFNILSPFKSCECNLISDKLCLTSVEKTNIAKTYIGTSMTDIDDLSFKCDFFPLLCSLYHEKEDVDVKEYFKNPFDVYKSELDRLSEHGDEGNYKLCSLALCVLFNNQLNETWFQGKMTDDQRQIIQDTCEACEFNSIPKAKLKKALDTLDGTFIGKQNGIYRTIHDKLFDFLAHYFGQTMISCLIDHGDSKLVHERFIWQKSPDDKNSNIDFIIEIPDDYLESYLERFIKDWSVGKVSAVFSNNNIKVSSFRQKLIQYLLQLDKPQQVILASTKDTVRPKEDCASGNTPLIGTCYTGYTDIVQWILHNGVDVDQCRDDGITGLIMASQEGHSDIVTLLLEKTPNVNLCNKNGCSPLFIASNNGHTDIAKLLLEKNPNVDLCNKNGCSPLFMASQEGHTDIVKLLLEKDTNVNLCNKNGCSPLFMASQERHTDIVKLLLEKDPNVDLFDKDGCSPLFIASNNGHTDIAKLLLEKNPNVDLCNKNGCSPLFMASQEGHTDIVKLLLEKDTNVNLCNKNGCSPLFMASQERHTDIVKLLLENNADCNICVHSKESIADTYTNHQQYTLDKLKQGLFNVFVEDKSSHVADYVNKKLIYYVWDVVAGCSPLHIACFVGNIDIVSCLLDHNADINMTKEDGTSPLFFACEVGHEDIVCLLLDKGADTQICRLGGASPLTIATDNGHTSIVMMLTNHTKKEES
ncbi:uncharacterized protein LOC143054464 isoform X3 [Mytilus galloprovincialis]|uniref:uncharacterized protein LOC143054464 isoform X3 n=1 Tax=Mytilus galloprovincialis TaxID=29158 RepID=UPI003F7C75B4